MDVVNIRVEKDDNSSTEDVCSGDENFSNKRKLRIVKLSILIFLLKSLDFKSVESTMPCEEKRVVIWYLTKLNI